MLTTRMKFDLERYAAEHPTDPLLEDAKDDGPSEQFAAVIVIVVVLVLLALGNLLP